MRAQFTVDGFTVVVRTDKVKPPYHEHILVAVSKSNIKKRITGVLTVIKYGSKYYWEARRYFDGSFKLWGYTHSNQLFDSQQEAFNSLVDFVKTQLSREIPSESQGTVSNP